MAKFNQKEKFAEVKAKLESYCAYTDGVTVDYDEKGDQFVITRPGLPVATIQITNDKVISSDLEFTSKVINFVADNGGVLPAVVPDAERGELQKIFDGIPDMGIFKELKIETIMHAIAPKATPQEFIHYLMEAKLLGLNPLLPGEFYFVKTNAGVYHHVGVAAFLRRAQQNTNIIRYEAGVIVLQRGKPDSPPIYRNSELVIKQREDLVGGWCKIWTRDRDPDDPVVAEVGFEEYNTGQSTWLKKPGTMITKVAVYHGMRKVDPRMSCMYGAEELGIDPAKEVKMPGQRGFIPGSELSHADIITETEHVVVET